MLSRQSRTCVVCGKEFEVPSRAEHKRFCSAECRGRFHEERRKRAEQLLREKEQGNVS